MRNWFFPVLVVCLLAAVLVLFLRPLPRSGTIVSPPAPANSTNSQSSSVPSAHSAAPVPVPAMVPVLVMAHTAPTQPPPATVALLPPDLLNVSPTTVLENMRTTFHQYASVFGGNPVGTNQEITRQLLGENSKHMNFLQKSDGNRVNSNDELVDIWGTPYFFHQLSGTEMEIRSAGPDRKMWTEDDLVIR